MSLSLSSFDYHLPDEAIAQSPVEPRDSSKLLIVDRTTGNFTDRHFFDLAEELTDKDVLVLNDTKVFPARLFVEKLGKNPNETVRRKPTELLLEKEIELSTDTITWECLTKPGLKVGDRVQVPNTHVTGLCTAVNGYTRYITFAVNREHFMMLLDSWAQTPIPPYIRWEGNDEQELRKRYQTVFAIRVGAMAAPTAGLHFTKQLLNTLKAKGVQIEYVTLHVGLGTFLPVKADDITAHDMHSEWFELSQPTAERLNDAKANGKRIIAVGTTVVRVLETCTDLSNRGPSISHLKPGSGFTQIFIYPPYQFAFVDSLITNFHTPKSTLLMLVSALVSAPNTAPSSLDISALPPFTTFETSSIGKAYVHALSHSYRFYSFGDSMWII